MSVVLTVQGEVDVKVIYVDANKMKNLLDKHTPVTLKGMELRIESETGRINLNFKSARPSKKK